MPKIIVSEFQSTFLKINPAKGGIIPTALCLSGQRAGPDRLIPTHSTSLRVVPSISRGTIRPRPFAERAARREIVREPRINPFGILRGEAKPNAYLVLASKSAARERLLKEIGLRFICIPPKVKENKSKKNIISLVKDNALRKAYSVAQGLREGIVISCDTIATVGKKIVGKPSNIKQAKEILKASFKNPVFVYTGIAVLDVRNKKILVDYEKTKVYFNPLNNKEIDKYFKMITPLDKAGAFDIQGIGSFFVRRIEGCFYNVVGLPLAKLYQMLKKVGVNIL